MTPESCPNCGADVPRGAAACPGCGADENTGWSDDAYASGLDLPDDSFDYEEFKEREFGAKRALPYGMKWRWAGVALLLALIFAFGFYFFRSSK
ncbi:MAG TPA: zinc ribbon domain-containing protein [Verrucomicrobiae bacterium]|jgi:uncharacterized membrane protein YvbJ|nr:zinc ribbon domain-containing protein [Verrucomicrobiae bacterium]